MRKYTKRICIIIILALALLMLVSCNSTELTIPNVEGEVGAFELQTPQNDADEVSIIPTFTWENAPNANNYTLVIATDENFEDIIFTRASLAQNEFKMSSKLYSNTQYFWRIKAKGVDEGNEVVSSVATFSTKAEERVEEEQILDDFESYEYVALLQSEYYAPNGDAAQIRLLENSADSDFLFKEFFDNGRILEVEYNLHTQKFSNFTRNLHRSLLGTDGISFKIGNLGSSIKIVLDIFEKGGEGFRVYVPVRGVAPYTVYIPYSAFARHMDAGIPQDGILQVEDISKFTIAIATDAEVASGIAYIDDLKAYVDKAYTTIENTGYIAEALEQNGPIIDLNNLSTQELAKNMDYHEDGGISTFAVEGEDNNKQLKWVYSFDAPANKYWSMIRYYGYWNLEENDGISLRIKGNASNQRLIIQVKDADGEFFNLKLMINFSNEIEIQIPFSTLILKGVEDWGVEVDGLLYKQIINEISFTMESDVYTSAAQGGTLYLSDICGFSDSSVKGLTIGGVDVQSVDLSHGFEAEENFDIANMAFTNATGEIDNNSSLFDQNALKVVLNSTDAKVSFEYSPQLQNASGIALWARASEMTNLVFVLQASDGNDYRQNIMLNEGLNFVVLKMNAFKNGSTVLNLSSLEIENFYFDLYINNNDAEVLFDEIYAYNVYNSAIVGERLAEIIGKEMVSLPSPDEINNENYEEVKERTDAITWLIMSNMGNSEILFSLISLAPYITKFFAVLNRIDDIVLEQTFEFGSIFTANMVVQHGTDFLVYGFGKAGEEIEVTFSGVEDLGIDSITLTATADDKGRFEVVFPKDAMVASLKARTLKAKRQDEREISVAAILVGNVYMVMGQSSLLNNVPNGVTFEKNINVRIYNSSSPLSGSAQQTTLDSSWSRTNTGSYIYANSLLSYIGNELYKKDTSMPIGIIALAYGSNTPIEAYASIDLAVKMVIDNKEGYHSGSIYNTYIHPLLGIGISSVIIMHGGGIVTDSEQYKSTILRIQQDIQNNFTTNDLSLYIVQSMILSRFTDFSYTAAQASLIELENINVIPATDATKLDAEGLQIISTRLINSLTGSVIYPFVTGIERTQEGFDITFSEPIKSTGALNGFVLGNEAGEYDQDCTASIEENNVVSVKCSSDTFVFNNVFYNVSGKGNLISVDNDLPVGSFGTFNPYNIQSYNFIDEMKYESMEDFNDTWQYRVAGVAQSSTNAAVSLINGERKINYKYFSKGMQIIATPVNTAGAARDITDIRIWVKTTKTINFQIYLWFGAYPTDAKRYNTVLSVNYPEGGYIYIPLINVWGTIENLLDSLTHIGIGLDSWEGGSMEIGEISFIKAEAPARFSLVKPTANGVVAPNSPIEFLWEVSKRAQSYLLEIYDSNDNIIKSVETNKFYYSFVEGFADGDYAYTITAINDKGEFKSSKVAFKTSELVRTDRLYQDFELTENEFKENFEYRKYPSPSSGPWCELDEVSYATLVTIEREDGEESSALKIDSTIVAEAYQNYYLAVRDDIDCTDAYGARYLKFWYSSNVDLDSISSNSRIEINFYIGGSHFYVQLFNIKKGEGYIYVALSDFTIGSGSEKFDVTRIDSYSIGINVSQGAVVYFDEISLTYKK